MLMWRKKKKETNLCGTSKKSSPNFSRTPRNFSRYSKGKNLTESCGAFVILVSEKFGREFFFFLEHLEPRDENTNTT